MEVYCWQQQQQQQKTDDRKQNFIWNGLNYRDRVSHTKTIETCVLSKSLSTAAATKGNMIF